MLSLLIDLVVIFGLAVLAALVCHRLRLPTAIGLLVGGVLAGPELLGLVRNVHEIELLAEIGVVLLLFVIGLEISVADLARLQRFFTVGGTVQFFGTAAVVAGVLLPTGLSGQQALYLGFVAALSSTAIVLRMLQERAELDTPHGRSVLSILIYQDIGVVPVMLMAPLLAGGAGGSGLGAIGLLLAKVALVGAFGFCAYRWLVPFVLERITRTRSSEATAVHDLRIAVPNLATHSLRLGSRSPLLGATIATSRLREDYGVNVLAVTREGEAIGNPPGELAFQQGDVLFLIGPTDWEADQIT